MSVTTLSARAFNQDSGKAKKAALDGPVFITDRGEPSHVLLSIADYRRLTSAKRSIVDILSMPGNEDFELDLPKREIDPRIIDLD